MAKTITDIKDTAEYARLLVVRNYIQNNKQHFQLDTIVPTPSLLKALGVSKPKFKGMDADQIIAASLSYGRERSAWQTRFNRILAQRGLYMSYKHGTFRIKTRKQTVEKVASLRLTAERRIARANELALGIKNYNGVYSKVKAPVLVQIAKGLIAR